MPEFRRLPPEEATLYRASRPRPTTLKTYEDFLKELDKGDVFQARPDPQQSIRALKSLLTKTARSLGAEIEYIGEEEGQVVVEVITPAIP